MKQTINEYQFRDAFQIRPNSFSYEGLGVLFEFFEQWDEDCETETELDPIAICCEFSESTPGEIISDYSVDGFREDNAVSAITGSQWRIYGDRELDELLEWLNDRTLVCGVTDSGNIVYQDF